jgi:hypothetical protein
MTTTTAVQTDRASLLKNAILGNATFTFISGLVLAIASNPIAEIMGVEDYTVLFVTGLILIPYAFFLYRVATQEPISSQFAITAILLDIAWVIGSILLLVSELVPLTTVGKWGVAIIADIVALFAVVQYLGLRRVKPTA